MSSDCSNKRRKTSDQYPSDDEAEVVVELSSDQRPAVDGEPVCIVCGRYGAYICDDYNVDVCSRECKGTYRAQQTQSQLQVRLACEAKRTFQAYHVSNVLTEFSREQKLALPHEPKCLICGRLGIADVLACGQVCSSECKKIFMTPDNLLISPPFKIHSEIACLTSKQISELRETMGIKINEGDVPPVILDFKHAGFSSTLAENIMKCGFQLPTTVQSQAIPAVLDGSDLLVASATSTGKTAAYLLPVIHRLSTWVEYVSKSHVLAVILLPTRDIAQHVEKLTKELCRGINNMKTALVVGGLSMAKQTHRLDSGIQIVVATPGRLLELSPDLSQCYTIVIDECDVLLDASFHEQVKSIVRLLPSRHQTLMFSATLSEVVCSHAKQLLYHPVHLTVGKLGTAADKVKQIILWVENDSKKSKLMLILRDKRYYKPPVLIFVESKFGALLLAEFLISKDVLCGVIHGDKAQEDRNKIIGELENGRYPVLVSTNILGRGLNLPSVSQVILFDMPQLIDQYTHQVGRAYTVGTPGMALVFINNSNKAVFLDFYELAKSTGVILPKQLTNSPYLVFQRQNKTIMESKKNKGKS